MNNAASSAMCITPVFATAGPSLALIKYWGKSNNGVNIPATTSIAVTLDTLQSTVQVSKSDTDIDMFTLNDVMSSIDNINPVLNTIRIHAHHTMSNVHVHIDAHNNFPTSAGLASSASGMAAVTAALSQFFQTNTDVSMLSKWAQLGSGSACRSVFGGFTEWRANSTYATPIASSSHWDNFRVIIIAVTQEKKLISSRDAMITTSNTSPYFESWVSHNNTLAHDAVNAIHNCDLEKLGTLARISYSAMHACTLAAVPPILYLKPESVRLIEHAHDLRKNNIPVWETMDAGPQVKYLTESTYCKDIISSVQDLLPNVWIRVCAPGDGVHIIESI